MNGLKVKPKKTAARERPFFSTKLWKTAHKIIPVRNT